MRRSASCRIVLPFQRRVSLRVEYGRIVVVMTLLHIQVKIPTKGIVGAVQIREFRNKRSWIICQWMECDEIDAPAGEPENSCHSSRWNTEGGFP